ncbi:hypothetical protein, partial [Sphingomonas bacterium]|uniref:hypothetical protein n=1 Tax=Sphingomonas bacterium TaxID=1895847 RepID=UPI0015766F4A
MISAGGDRAGRETLCRFDRPYLLALNVGLRSHAGLYWADASWAKDLTKHAAYLPRLTLFCPIEQGAPPAGWQALDPDAF